jgi:membrane protein required for colicin V production
MIGNGLDIAIIVILLATLILGLVKGLVRQVIGIAAVIAGLILAARYYRPVSGVFGRIFYSEKWASFVAFILIFIVVLALGALLSFLVCKLLCGPLKFIDHLLGGVFGLVQGLLICGVLVIGLLIFPVNREFLTGSRLAPYCYWLTKGMVQLIPQDLKNQFNETYREIIESARQHGKEI